MIKENKIHWYDGWFYDRFIAPNQDELFQQIINLIEPNLNIIDVGCGTGRFSFSITDKCKSVLGIDLSKRNIDKAQLNILSRPNEKISFRHTKINVIISEGKQRFDYAIMTYVIHEVDEPERIPILNEMAMIADKIIIGDYLVPREKGFGNFLTEAIEFVAGREHYRNFKTYVAHGGIPNLAQKAGLKIISEIKNQPKGTHIAILSR